MGVLRVTVENLGFLDYCGTKRMMKWKLPSPKPCDLNIAQGVADC